MVRDYASPPTKESSLQSGLVELDIEASSREVYEIVEAQIEAEEGFTMGTGPRGLKDAEEDASLRTKDGAYAVAGRAPDGDMREGAEQATLSSCGEWTAIDEVGDYEEGVATDTDVRMEVATDTTSDDAATLHTPVLETPAAGPSTGVRPRVTDGGGDKAGDHDGDMREGAEQATLSSCGKRTATDKAGSTKQWTPLREWA